MNKHNQVGFIYNIVQGCTVNRTLKSIEVSRNSGKLDSAGKERKSTNKMAKEKISDSKM
jgi:hypothetical protein